MQLNKQVVKSVGLGLLAASAVLAPMVLFAADAQDLSGLSTNLSKQVGAAESLLKNVARLAGVGFVLAGLVKFKAHKDNPTQVALSVPITLLLIGGALVGLPSIVSTSSKTLGATETAAAAP